MLNISTARALQYLLVEISPQVGLFVILTRDTVKLIAIRLKGVALAY